MKFYTSIAILLLCCVLCGFDYTWQIDETPQGQESVTVVHPVVVTLYDTPIEVPAYSSALNLIKRYNIFLDTSWTDTDASKLYLTFQTVPQRTTGYGDPNPYDKRHIEPTIWSITDRHLHNDIEIKYQHRQKRVTISRHALTYAYPLLADIDGVSGRYFSKRLHRAVVRYATNNGLDYHATRRILRDRYDVSIDVPDYSELTKYTTGEHAERFSEFKDEEIIALINMLEEFPSGMLKTPGLKYLVRRLDGTPHPLYPNAPAVAWPTENYIEFMESAFSAGNLEFTHRLVLHEKAHFLWAYLFNDQLKADWIELGGWYQNPDDQDGWSTTKQTEFVSAYAHGINPDEDMAESISFYIVNPDKLRSRSPAKYEFIQNRIMHGTRYISQIREDLTFEVYNLYPDYVYPGRIVRVNVQVTGEPMEDKQITVELELHSESELDTAQSANIRIFSEKGTYFDVRVRPIDENGMRLPFGHILRGATTLSKYAVNGYWAPDAITLTDAQGNARHGSQSDFGWKLYIDNPLADCEPPQYVPNSMTLSLSKATTKEGMPYQIVTAQWQVIEQSGLGSVRVNMNDTHSETYSRYSDTRYNRKTDTAKAELKFPEYMPSGIYKVSRISMTDIARNGINIYFTDSPDDEEPQTIEIKTTNPDLEPPVLDVNRITIKAEPTQPDDPNGETIVDISFYVKDNISGYHLGGMRLRDPHGVTYHYYQDPESRRHMYFPGDPTVYKQYQRRIVLPVGSVPGTWGLAQIAVSDKAYNHNTYDFTEIVRFVVTDAPTDLNTDVNGDGKTDILDLVSVAHAFDAPNDKADINADGTVNIQDLVLVANDITNTN